MRSILFSPSLMCADVLEPIKEIRELEKAGADFFHIDIMDGHFVPNLALGTDYVAALTKRSAVPADVHLMVEEPERYIDMLSAAGASYVTFHHESTRFPIRLMELIREKGMKAGVALNPATNAADVASYIGMADMALVMAVEPGFAGQSFIDTAYAKIKALKEMAPGLLIEVDGSINLRTAARCLEAGADSLVLGTSSIFRKAGGVYENYVKFRDELKVVGSCTEGGI